MTRLSNGSRFLMIAVGLVVASEIGRANDIYLGQNAAGANNGTNCANALPVSFFNTAASWGNGTSQIGPGTTVHLCGTIVGTPGSTGLGFRGSGTAGNPITLLFENGAQLNAPYWLWAIETNGYNYITINGGANGIVQNTNNGTRLTYQQPSTLLVASNCNNCIIENLSLINGYIHYAGDSNTVIDQTLVRALQYTGSNVLVTNNVIHDCGWCVENFYGSDVNSEFSHNNLYNFEHGLAIGPANSTAAASFLLIHDNQIHDSANWDCTNLGCHHDGIHIFASPTDQNTLGNLYVYNNYWYGSWGTTATGFIYVEGATSPAHVTSSYWWNNVFLVQNPNEINNQGWVGIFSGSAKTVFVNNTMLGPGTADLTFCYGMGAPAAPMPNLTFENNVGTKCGGMVTFNNTTGTVDYNYYGITCHFAGQPYNNCFAYNGTFEGTLASWQGASGWDAHSINNNTSTAFNSDGSPQTGAPTILVGANLSSIASGYLATLSSDTTLGGTRAAISRPTAGAWDIGAYVFKTSSSTLNAPTGISTSIQ